jgi:hypothetical protein
VSATTTQGIGGWTTRVEVRRNGEAWMPVTLRVGDVDVRLGSREPVQIVEVRTTERPERAVLDPEGVLLDLVPGNNVVVVVGG